MKGLTIGETARRAGVGVETIRFYERRGLIEQPAKPGRSGFRLYPAEIVKRLRFIRQAQQLGFSLREIGELLALQADPNTDCAEVREQALMKLREVRSKIDQLREIGAALEALIAVCPGQGGLRICTILDTLAGSDVPAGRGGPLLAAPPQRRPRNGAGKPGRWYRRIR